MQIGIDLGATKIEYVLLDNQNKELTRNRISTPKDYIETIKSIISIIKDIESKNKKNLNFGMKRYLLYHRLIQQLTWESRVKKKSLQSHIF